MARMILLNLPVQDVVASTAFFGGLGFAQNPQFSDENTSAVVISDTIVAMLMHPTRFAQFTPRTVADATQSTEVLLALSADTREEVDQLADKALSSGGGAVRDAQDHGFMYGRSLSDLDGHIWEVVWTDPATVGG